MIHTSEMHQLIDSERITYERGRLPIEMDGFYYSHGSTEFIIVDDRISEYDPRYRSVLGEEIGHYYTTCGSLKNKNKTSTEKDDNVALKWATGYLLPTDMLLYGFLNKTLTDVISVAEIYDVPVEFALLKFKIMSFEKLMWPLGENHFLVLSDLPNIYTYSAI